MNDTVYMIYELSWDRYSRNETLLGSFFNKEKAQSFFESKKQELKANLIQKYNLTDDCALLSDENFNRFIRGISDSENDDEYAIELRTIYPEQD